MEIRDTSEFYICTVCQEPIVLEIHKNIFFLYIGEYLTFCVYAFCMILGVKSDYFLKQPVILVMVMCGVLFEVRTEFLNNI
jgi:hypothetical protein